MTRNGEGCKFVTDRWGFPKEIRGVENGRGGESEKMGTTVARVRKARI